MGNSIVLKPSEFTSLSAWRVAELAVEAGVPAGVVNMVNGRTAEIGEELTSSPTVRKLTFTGSTEVGKKLVAACAAALAVLDVIEEEGPVERANIIAALFKDRLHELKDKYPEHIGDIRADRGAMIAIELVQDGNPDAPDPDLTKKILAETYARGLVTLTCGVRGNVFRFLPALTMPDEIVAEGLDIFLGALDKCVQELPS